MKTKFILHGGFNPKATIQEDDSFFNEILKDTPSNPKLLLVYFAKEVDRIQKNMNEDIVQFTKNSNGRNISFELAEEEKFLEQIPSADVIYLHGGSTKKILETIVKFSNLDELFKGKIVAADSAGVNAISKYCYSQRGGILRGVGIIPYKIICHYTEELKDKIEELNKYDNNLELLLLKELETKVFVTNE